MPTTIANNQPVSRQEITLPSFFYGDVSKNESQNSELNTDVNDDKNPVSRSEPTVLLAASSQQSEAKSRLYQSNLVLPEIQQSISNFLGVDLGRRPDGSPTDEYYRIDDISKTNQSSGGLGFVGIEPKTGQIGAYIDFPNINRWASALGVDAKSLGSAVGGQELTQAALMVHPQFKGKYSIQENEVIGEAYAFKTEGPAFLGRHMSRMSVQDSKYGDDNYRDMPGITNPALGKVAAQYGIGVPGMSKDERAKLFLSDFDDFMRQRLNSAFLGNPPKGEAVAVYAQERFGIEDGTAFSNDLAKALTDAYGARTRTLLDRAKQTGEPAASPDTSYDEQFLTSSISFKNFTA